MENQFLFQCSPKFIDSNLSHLLVAFDIRSSRKSEIRFHIELQTTKLWAPHVIRVSDLNLCVFVIMLYETWRWWADVCDMATARQLPIDSISIQVTLIWNSTKYDWISSFLAMKICYKLGWWLSVSTLPYIHESSSLWNDDNWICVRKLWRKIDLWAYGYLRWVFFGDDDEKILLFP